MGLRITEPFRFVLKSDVPISERGEKRGGGGAF